MNKNISKVKIFLMKNYSSILLALLICGLIIYSVMIKYELNKYTLEKDITGTYMITENQLDSEYLVFMEGVFYRYKQFELLDEGIYEKIDNNTYIIKSEKINECITYVKDTIPIYNREQGYVIIFNKVNDIPTFINIDIDNK